jgi:hypothetical protein
VLFVVRFVNPKNAKFYAYCQVLRQLPSFMPSKMPIAKFYAK